MIGSNRPARRDRTAEAVPDRARVARPDAPEDGGLVLATRGSELALAQTRLVGDALSSADPGIAWRILPITTRGDRSAGAGAGGRGEPVSGDQSAASGSRLAELARVSPGVFTSEVAAAVVRGEAAGAVHSLKDLPLDDRDGLCLAALLPRAAAGDVLVTAPEWFDATEPLGLRRGAVVGTSSPRRAALLRHFAPQARVTEVRGNVPTRLRRCGAGEVAAVVLAQAGLQRLGARAQGLRVLPLPPEHWQPAPGQGAIAVQARCGGAAAAALAAIDHSPTRTAVELERAVLRALGGGCATACGAYARRLADRKWELRYGLADPGGTWRSYRVRDSAAGCHSALAAWAEGAPPPGRELSADRARDHITAVLFGTT